MPMVQAGQRIVLVAEDNQNDVEILKLALQRKGAEGVCRFVRDGEEAIAYLRGDPPFADRLANPFPALVVVELRLRGVDGLGVLDWILKTAGCESVKAVVWSGWLYGEQKMRAAQAGARWVVDKDAQGAGLAELVALISGGAFAAGVIPDGGSEPQASAAEAAAGLVNLAAIPEANGA